MQCYHFLREKGADHTTVKGGQLNMTVMEFDNAHIHSYLHPECSIAEAHEYLKKSCNNQK